MTPRARAGAGRSTVDRLLVLLLAGGLTGCATVPSPRCAAGETAAVNDLLYFGTARPTGIVTDAQWADFLAEVVTPRFPAGLSSWPAAGQWQSPGGGLIREASHVLSLLHPDDDASDQAVRAITEAYRRRFEQEAVLRVRSAACLSQ